MPLGLLGKKIGMTQLFDDKGAIIPVTLIEAGPCPILQKRTEESDGYNAVQLGFDAKPERLVNKAGLGHFKKAGATPQRYLREIRGEETTDMNVGDSISVTIFEAGELVDVIGTTKGRGFTSPRKRHGLKPGPKSHGSKYHNRPGSNGGSSQPARTFPGKKMAGHDGALRVTAKNLQIVRADAEKNLLIIKGSIPGANGGYVIIRKGVKK
ncbi:MAG: 50S ribosomal protein L3 [Candidatus Sumerlaeota bacterium]